MENALATAEALFLALTKIGLLSKYLSQASL
jgi:hypothetical protein